jgi:glucose/mannose-6-phosphate isomerase
MLRLVGELPDQCETAWSQMMATDLALPRRDFDNVLIMGMGGSAIGGDLTRTLVADEAKIPVVVNRDYTVPAFVSERTLAVASSYSGNTEETLSALDYARSKGATIVAISTDGELERVAADHGLPWVPVNYKGAQPRAALGWSLVILLGVAFKAGIITDRSRDVSEAVGVMRRLQAEINEHVPSSQNPAKQLALDLYGKLPVVYGSGHLSEVARRWKGQYNENSKNWAFFEIMPELNHNAVLGYRHPAELAKDIVVILLRSSLDHPRTAVRFDVTQEILDRRGVEYRVARSRGESALANVLSSIHFGDYTSYYLAQLNCADPTTVDMISYLKQRLAEVE